MTENSQELPPKEVKVSLRVIKAEGYTGPAIVKIAQKTRFQQVYANKDLKFPGFLSYQDRLLEPGKTPTDYGMVPGVQYEVRLIPKEPASAPGTTTSDPSPAAGPPHDWRKAPSEASSTRKSVPDQPENPAPQFHQEAQGVVTTGSMQGSEGSTAVLASPAAGVTPVSRPQAPSTASSQPPLRVETVLPTKLLAPEAMPIQPEVSRPADQPRLPPGPQPSKQQQLKPPQAQEAAPVQPAVTGPPPVSNAPLPAPEHKRQHQLPIVSAKPAPTKIPTMAEVAHAAMAQHAVARPPPAPQSSHSPAHSGDIQINSTKGPGGGFQQQRREPSFSRAHLDTTREIGANHALDHHTRPHRGQTSVLPQQQPYNASPTGPRPATGPYQYYSPESEKDSFLRSQAPQHLTIQPLPPVVVTPEQLHAVEKAHLELRKEVEWLKEELETERHQRELLESQVRQMITVMAAQLQGQRMAAAEDNAAREHQKLMEQLRSERKRVPSSSTPPH